MMDNITNMDNKNALLGEKTMVSKCWNVEQQEKKKAMQNNKS